DLPIYQRFVETFAERVRAMRIGPGLSDPDIGPLINERAIEKQRQQVEDALARGARLVCGGKVNPAGPLFFDPTVLAEVPDDALVFREERSEEHTSELQSRENLVCRL